MSFGVGHKSLDLSKLTFGDQIDSSRGFIYNTKEPLISTKVNYLDIYSGFLLYSKSFNFGFSLGHVNHPDTGFTENSKSKVPLKYSTHFACVFKQDSLGFQFSPEFLLINQGPFYSLQVNADLKYSHFLLG